MVVMAKAQMYESRLIDGGHLQLGSWIADSL